MINSEIERNELLVKNEKGHTFNRNQDWGEKVSKCNNIFLFF
jgi:hypothetical protein